MAYHPNPNSSALPVSPAHNTIAVEPERGTQWIWNKAYNQYVALEPTYFCTQQPANTIINRTGNYDGAGIGIYLPTFSNYTSGNEDISYQPRYLLEYLNLEIKSGTNLDATSYYDLVPYVADLPATGIVNLNVSPIRVNSIAKATMKRYNWIGINYLIPYGKTVIGVAATETRALINPTITTWKLIARTRLVNL